MQIAVAVSAFCQRLGVGLPSDFRYGNYRFFPGFFPAHWRRVAVALPPRQFPVISRGFGVPFTPFWRVFFEATPKPLLRPHFRSVMPLGCNSAAQQNQSSIFLGELTCPSLSALLMLAMATSNSLMALMVNPSWPNPFPHNRLSRLPASTNPRFGSNVTPSGFPLGIGCMK